MTTLLHINTSVRIEGSRSRQLSGEFVTAYRAKHPDAKILYRDLRNQPPSFVTQDMVGAAYTPEAERNDVFKAAIAESDALVNELLSADIIVLGLPMYNFSVPAVFKAYIDQIVRVGRTFAVTPEGYKGLIPAGKKLVVITARGGDYSEKSPAAAYDFQEPYIRSVFGFMGITDVTFINGNGLDNPKSNRESILSGMRAQIPQVIERLVA